MQKELFTSKDTSLLIVTGVCFLCNPTALIVFMFVSNYYVLISKYPLNARILNP